MVQVGPCSSWVDQASVEAIGFTPDDIEAETWGQLAEAATSVLFRLSGARYAGECSTTVRPHRISHPDHRRHHLRHHIRNLNEPCWERVHEVLLGAYPVTEVTNVTIDGVTVDPSIYRVDGARVLVREDGQGWPCCQNLNLPPGQKGTWTVSFTYGTLPDRMGLIACAELTRQLGLAVTQNDKCRLPQRVQTITRQGVGMTILDPQDFLDHGRTGIYLIDLWLKAVNPDGRRRRARVISPDWGAPARIVAE